MARRTRKIEEKPANDALLEAHSLIRGPRAKFYGDPRVNFKVIAEMWDAYLKAKLAFMREDPLHAGPLVSDFDVSQMMVLLKTARGIRGYHRDSSVDKAGYAGLDEILCDDEAYERFIVEILQ